MGANSAIANALRADQRVYGYEIRKPLSDEDRYFKENPNVSGMAADDGKIILNAYSKLTPEERNSVARNEAARLYMRETGMKFNFPVPQIDQAPFKGSVYADPKNLHHLQSTVVARIIAGDPSVGTATTEQITAADKIRSALSEREMPQLSNRVASTLRQAQYGTRSDGTPKGAGFFGELNNPNGSVSTELSTEGGALMPNASIPLLAPGLTAEQVMSLQSGSRPTNAMYQNAQQNDFKRLQQGLPAYAVPGEMAPYPSGYTNGLMRLNK